MISLILERADLDAIALSLASGIGLALGVDYSLLIVTRFRESLDDGLAPKQAASLAANTAGRTAIFAGFLLIAIMPVSFFLSPGTVLLSSAVGAIVATALSMLGAALVTPGGGHAARATTSTGGSSAAGGREPQPARRASSARDRARPALAAALVLGAPDARGRAGLGAGDDPARSAPAARGQQGPGGLQRRCAPPASAPTVEVVLRAPKGAVMDPRRLKQIAPFEERLRQVRYVSSVFGPRHARRADQGAARRAPLDQARPARSSSRASGT